MFGTNFFGTKFFLGPNFRTLETKCRDQIFGLLGPNAGPNAGPIFGTKFGFALIYVRNPMFSALKKIWFTNGPTKKRHVEDPRTTTQKNLVPNFGPNFFVGGETKDGGPRIQT